MSIDKKIILYIFCKGFEEKSTAFFWGGNEGE